MSILFFILKIIGILILIPIVLLLILLIFPICYQMEGDFADKTPKAQAKVSWAVVFLRAKVCYEEELNFAIRIFGIPVYDSRKGVTGTHLQTPESLPLHLHPPRHPQRQDSYASIC